MKIVNKKLKALLLLIGMVVFTIPTFATSLTANAGVDQELNVTANNTATVTLNGTASTGTIVKYEWFYHGDSLGTGATLNVSSVTSGYYTVMLVVTDSFGNTASDSVNVEVRQTSPSLTANAGEDINVTFSLSEPTVILDGTRSTGTIVKYEWFYNGDSIGTGSTLDVASVPSGQYTVMLMVTDNLGNRASDTVNVEIHACDETTPAITRKALMTMIGNGEDVTQVNTCKITDMSHLFDVGYWSPYPKELQETVRNFNQDISGWDTSNVTNMKEMFYEARAFNQPLNSWNVSKVTDMRSMFYKATSFNQLLDSWDVSSVTDMLNMFSHAVAFNQPLDSWDVSNVTSMSNMFYGATAFNQPLNNWELSSMIDMGFMFSHAVAFNQPLDSWNVSSVTFMNNMFYEATAFNQNISNWDVSHVVYHSNFANGSALENAYNPFYQEVVDTTKPVITLLGNVTVTLTVGDTYIDAGATATDNIDGNITSNIQVAGLPINTSIEGNYTVTYSVSDTSGNVADVVTRTVIVKSVDSTCDEATAITRETLITMIGNGDDVTQVNTCKITDMSHLFDPFVTYPASQIQTVRSFNQDISGWNTVSVTNMEGMFYNATAFNQSLDSWDVSNVTNMVSMFDSASTFNQTLNSWDVSHVTNMEGMFESATAFNQPLESWTVSSVTNMSAMFIFASSFNQDISNWDVSNVQSHSNFATGSPLVNAYNPFN